MTLLHFNHGCEYSDGIQSQCEAIAEGLDLPIVTQKITGEFKKGQSLEDFWRRSRYRFLRNYCEGKDQKLVTVHHLDDAVETWLFSSIHGEGKLIPATDKTVIRPFLMTKKQQLIDYADKRGLIAVDDPFNREMHLARNYMRANMIHHVYKINPGIDTVIRKKYLKLKKEMENASVAVNRSTEECC